MGTWQPECGFAKSHLLKQPARKTRSANFTSFEDEERDVVCRMCGMTFMDEGHPALQLWPFLLDVA